MCLLKKKTPCDGGLLKKNISLEVFPGYRPHWRFPLDVDLTGGLLFTHSLLEFFYGPYLFTSSKAHRQGPLWRYSTYDSRSSDGLEHFMNTSRKPVFDLIARSPSRTTIDEDPSGELSKIKTPLAACTYEHFIGGFLYLTRGILFT